MLWFLSYFVEKNNIQMILAFNYTIVCVQYYYYFRAVQYCTKIRLGKKSAKVKKLFFFHNFTTRITIFLEEHYYKFCMSCHLCWLRRRKKYDFNTKETYFDKNEISSFFLISVLLTMVVRVSQTRHLIIENIWKKKNDDDNHVNMIKSVMWKVIWSLPASKAEGEMKY